MNTQNIRPHIDFMTVGLYYAFGQQDAGIGRGVDAHAFARSYAERHALLAERRVSHAPSVQDAWRAFLKHDTCHRRHQ